MLATELQERKAGQSTLPANLLGGAVGYCVFLILDGTGLADFLDLAPVSKFELLDVLWVVLLALLGMALAVIAGHHDESRPRRSSAGSPTARSSARWPPASSSASSARSRRS